MCTEESPMRRWKEDEVPEVIMISPHPSPARDGAAKVR